MASHEQTLPSSHGSTTSASPLLWTSQDLGQPGDTPQAASIEGQARTGGPGLKISKTYDRPVFVEEFGDEQDLEPTAAPPGQEKSRKKRQTATGGFLTAWWWEITAEVISLVCMGMILYVLARINDRRLSDWTYRIQPNSVISVLTTAGKTSMFVAIASCLRQLKWRHFAAKPRPLRHVELFEEASRGPLGSLLLLTDLSVRSVLAWGLAAVTILSLGVDPAAQQILEYPTRATILNGSKAELAVARSYLSRTFNSSGTALSNFNDAALSVGYTNSITAAVLGDVSDPFFTCPTTALNCTFPRYTTLGVCGTLTNVTGQINYTCSGGGSSSSTSSSTSFKAGTSTSTFFSTSTTESAISVAPFVIASSATSTTAAPSTSDIGWKAIKRQSERDEVSSGHQVGVNCTYDFGSGSTIELLGTDVFKLSEISTEKSFSRVKTMGAVYVAEAGYSPYGTGDPGAQLYIMQWDLCAQTFDETTATASQISVGPSSTEQLAFTYQDPEYYVDGSSYYGPVHFIANSTGTNYTIDWKTGYSMGEYLIKSLKSEAYVNAGMGGTELEPGESNQIGTALYLSNLTRVADDTARQLSAQIRSRNGEGGATSTSASTSTSSDGDNMNATAITGTVYGSVTFVHVRWGWVVWPVAESALAGLLLVCTIVVTRSKTQLQLKTSALGLAYHGLDEQTVSHIREAVAGGQETKWALVKAAKGVVVMLADDGERGRRFVRT